MAPKLSRLAEEYGDKLVVLKVDVNRQQTMARKAGVQGIPDTRLLYMGRQLERKTGSMTYLRLENLVLKNMGELPPVVEVEADEVADPVEIADPPEVEISGVQIEKKTGNGDVQPMKDDWLPPGVTRE